MNISRRKTFWGLNLIILCGIFAVASIADDERRTRHHREDEHHEDRHDDSEYLKPVRNATYADECGACHFAYPPELLPSASWRLILNGTQDHFGESVDLDEGARREIEGYLVTNAANRSTAELSRKILRSLAGRIPLRITDIPYIRREHHELPVQAVDHPSVGSLGNCIACHRNAPNGDFDDDRVSIPQ